MEKRGSRGKVVKSHQTVNPAKEQGIACTDGHPDEYATFESSLKKVLTVSHKEMQKRITRASADRASNTKP